MTGKLQHSERADDEGVGGVGRDVWQTSLKQNP